MRLPLAVVRQIRDSGAGEVIEEMAEAARKGYCFLYQNHPGWVLMKNNLTLPLVKRVLDDICDDGSDFTPPPLPEPPFTGGQCCDKTYIVSVSYYIANCKPGFVVLQGTDREVTVTGKVIGVGFGKPYPGTSSNSVYVEYETCGGTVKREPVNSTTARIPEGGCSSLDPNSREYGRSVDLDNSWMEITGIRTADGSSDDCGDPPLEWYKDPPPSDSDLTQDIDVTNVYGDTYTYNVTVNRDKDGTIKFAPTINVNRVSVTIDLGGITIGERSADDSSQGSDDEPEIIPKVKVELDKPLKLPQPPVPVKNRFPGAIQESNLVGLESIEIDITNIPSNDSRVSGHGTPTKIYPGWVEFSRGSYYYPKSYIDFEHTIYPAPEGADGYAICIKPGYNADIFKWIKEEQA